ncbi:S-adenosyl-L-methionine-dependent methyltransferase [Paxillus ammoniavirescens]|nr:S-adenosyl-L-methionine-dependent methyltransferase [Paxillus ammoniavirescens]
MSSDTGTATQENCAHVHHHNHAVHQHHHTNYEDANRHHFNETAHQYNDHPDAHVLAQKLGNAMKKTGLFKQGVTTVMDFACGTGLISQVLAAEDPKLIVGVDISQAMVDHYNKTVSDHDVSFEEMKAICVTELRENEKQLEGMTFDVIVCASSYHHFSSIDEVTKTLVSYLNPGGSLLVSDLIKDESSLDGVFPASTHHIVAHKGGFSEEDIRSTFEKAGLKNVTFETVAEPKLAGHPVSLFLARGDR